MDHTAFAVADQEHEAFLRAIGDLTLAWSDLEVALVRVLVRYAGVSDAVGRALFSGTRASGMISFLRAIADNTNMAEPRRADLEYLLQHIGAINTMRDFLVHHVDGSLTEFEPSNPHERILSDKRRAGRPAKTKAVFIGSSTLNFMRDDLYECCWRLGAHLRSNNEPFEPGFGTNGKRNPWKFTPPQPKRRPKGRK